MPHWNMFLYYMNGMSAQKNPTQKGFSKSFFQVYFMNKINELCEI